MPAEAGIQKIIKKLDSRFHGNDGKEGIYSLECLSVVGSLVCSSLMCPNGFLLCSPPYKAFLYLPHVHAVVILLRIQAMDLRVQETVGTDVLEIDLPAEQDKPGLGKVNKAAVDQRIQARARYFVGVPSGMGTTEGQGLAMSFFEEGQCELRRPFHELIGIPRRSDKTISDWLLP